MKFQALVFDLDGTAIPMRQDGMPSPAVIEAVRAAKKVCHVSIATGRPLELCRDILDALNIEDLSIVNGGTRLYSRKADEYVWEQLIDTVTLQEVFSELRAFGQYLVDDEIQLHPTPMAEYRTNVSVGLSCIFNTTPEDAQKILKIISKYKGLTAHAVNSWKAGTLDVHITHELATKKHALQSMLARLNVDIDKTMVVGDGGNDLPLFELAGWKVAMGNAQQILKDKADWIAPSVDDDGLAVAIRKFILDEQ